MAKQGALEISGRVQTKGNVGENICKRGGGGGDGGIELELELGLQKDVLGS
jgi:hypothetical protein